MQGKRSYIFKKYFVDLR